MNLKNILLYYFVISTKLKRLMGWWPKKLRTQKVNLPNACTDF